VFGTGYLESTGPRGPNHAGSEETYFNALGLHPSSPGSETSCNVALQYLYLQEGSRFFHTAGESGLH
jgi:hypothetical protein